MISVTEDGLNNIKQLVSWNYYLNCLLMCTIFQRPLDSSTTVVAIAAKELRERREWDQKKWHIWIRVKSCHYALGRCLLLFLET